MNKQAIVLLCIHLLHDGRLGPVWGHSESPCKKMIRGWSQIKSLKYAYRLIHIQYKSTLFSWRILHIENKYLDKERKPLPVVLFTLLCFPYGLVSSSSNSDSRSNVLRKVKTKYYFSCHFTVIIDYILFRFYNQSWECTTIPSNDIIWLQS